MTTAPDLTSTRRFLLALAITAFVPWLFVGAFNLVVDPLDVYRLVRVDGFNMVKPRAQRFERLARPLQLQRINAPVVILGTSRVMYGINPEDPYLVRDGQPAFNAGVSSATLKDVVPIARHAILASDVRELFVDVDMYMFNAFNGAPWQFPHLLKAADYDISYIPAQWLSTLPSWDIFDAARATVSGQDEEQRVTHLGWMKNEVKVRHDLEDRSLRDTFELLEYNYAAHMWTPCADGDYLYRNGYTGYDSFAALNELLELAAARDVRVVLFTQPAHARLWLALHEGGLWGAYEQWKRDLVAHVTQHQMDYPQADVSIWDFGPFHPVTEEPVPQASERAAVMTHYIDSAHYRSEVGHQMLALMHGEAMAVDPLFRDLGEAVDSSSLEARLADQRARRDAYRAANPQIVEDVARITEEGMAYRARIGIQCRP